MNPRDKIVLQTELDNRCDKLAVDGDIVVVNTTDTMTFITL